MPCNASVNGMRSAMEDQDCTRGAMMQKLGTFV